MGLRDTIRSLVNEAITSSIGDLKSTATFRSVTSTYDPTAGSTTETVTTYSCQCALVRLTQDDVIDVSLVTTGRKVLIPALQLQGVAIDSLNDEVDIDGDVYQVKQAKLDPSDALFIFVVVAKHGVQVRAD